VIVYTNESIVLADQVFKHTGCTARACGFDANASHTFTAVEIKDYKIEVDCSGVKTNRTFRVNVQNPPASPKKKGFLEKFTSANCSWCAKYQDDINAAKIKYPEMAVIEWHMKYDGADNLALAVFTGCTDPVYCDSPSSWMPAGVCFAWEYNRYYIYKQTTSMGIPLMVMGGWFPTQGSPGATDTLLSDATSGWTMAQYRQLDSQSIIEAIGEIKGSNVKVRVNLHKISTDALRAPKINIAVTEDHIPAFGYAASYGFQYFEDVARQLAVRATPITANDGHNVYWYEFQLTSNWFTPASGQELKIKVFLQRDQLTEKAAPIQTPSEEGSYDRAVNFGGYYGDYHDVQQNAVGDLIYND